MPDQSAGWLSPLLRSRRIHAVLPFLQEGNVLDYGCGTGELARYISDVRYLGVDRDQPSVDIARARFPQHRFLTSDEFLAASPGSPFDVVAGLAVIEHLPSPYQWLCQLKALLSEKGRVVLTTPDPRLQWAHSLGARVRLFSEEAAEEHQSLLDGERLRRLAGDAEFTVVHLRRFLFGCNQLCVLARN